MPSSTMSFPVPPSAVNWARRLELGGVDTVVPRQCGDGQAVTRVGVEDLHRRRESAHRGRGATA